MKKNRKKEIIDSVASALIPRRQEQAIELRELCMVARVSAGEAFSAINHLISAGFRVRVTDNFPRRFYMENGESKI